MPNGPEQAAYWRDFVIARCGYPNAARLAAQFEGAELAEFCICGCNSFSVRVRPDAPPLARKAKHGGVVFTADFSIAEGGQLEVMLSVDAAGNLDHVAVMCNANSCPVPDDVIASPKPFHMSASKHLIA